MKILILGGYGVFGGRLARLLADADLTILIAGRDLSKAQAFCATFKGQARPVQTSRATIAQALRTHRPDILIDASGPFQDYGTDPYSVLRACMDTTTNYLDFADGADFVSGVSQFDASARAAGIFALSGVSSFPVLTAAVLREMAKTMDITQVIGGIAPSPHAGVGLNVLRAVLGYAGAPVRLIRDGQPASGLGLAQTHRHTVAPPGALPLPAPCFPWSMCPTCAPSPPPCRISAACGWAPAPCPNPCTAC